MMRRGSALLNEKTPGWSKYLEIRNTLLKVGVPTKAQLVVVTLVRIRIAEPCIYDEYGDTMCERTPSTPSAIKAQVHVCFFLPPSIKPSDLMSMTVCRFERCGHVTNIHECFVDNGEL